MTQDEAIAILKPRLTPEFLASLVEAARTSGWSNDYIEVADFVEWCFEAAGQPAPSPAALAVYSDQNPDWYPKEPTNG